MNKVEELNSDNIVSSKISQILSLDPIKTSIEFEKKGNKNAIQDILKTNPKNKKLALYLIGEVDFNYFKLLSNSFRADNDIILLAIKSDSQNFEYIDGKLKNDINIAKQVLSSMICEGKNFFEIKEFINVNFGNFSLELFEYYEKKLSKFADIIGDDLSKTFIILSNENNDFIKKLKKDKVIIIKSKKIILNPDFINEFNNYFLKIEGFNSKTKQEQLLFKKTKLINDFGLQKTILNQNINYIFNLIINLSTVNEEKEKIVKINKKQNEDKEKQENQEKSKKADNKVEKEISIEDRIDTTLVNYNYFSTGDYFNIVTNENINIKISNSEKNEFTTKALENFIEFYKLLYKLGLNFLWDKYNGDLKTLISFKGISFNYTNGEGIGETTTLKILNLIGKNIGVPEREVLVNDSESKKEIRCFKTISDAKLEFNSIKSSSIINGEHIETNMSIGVVEKKLSLDDKINFAKGEINISKW